jgi:uncharacterized protein (DUF1778 family)
MTRKTPEQTARAADELYAHHDAPDLEGEIVDLKPAKSLSTVISVRLNADELATIEAAASVAGTKLGTFIRQAALAAAADTPPIPTRAGGVVVSRAQLARAVESAVRDLVLGSPDRDVPEKAVKAMKIVVRGRDGTTGKRATSGRTTAKRSTGKSSAGRRVGTAKSAKQAARADQPARRRSS